MFPEDRGISALSRFLANLPGDLPMGFDNSLLSRSSAVMLISRAWQNSPEICTRDFRWYLHYSLEVIVRKSPEKKLAGLQNVPKKCKEIHMQTSNVSQLTMEAPQQSFVLRSHTNEDVPTRLNSCPNNAWQRNLPGLITIAFFKLGLSSYLGNKVSSWKARA